MSDLNAPVLVLNSGWTPIHIKNVKDAVSDVFSEVAEIVEHTEFDIYSGDVFSSAYMGFKWSDWANVSSTAIPFLRKKAEEFRDGASALRAEAKIAVDSSVTKGLLSDADKLDAKAKATEPRIIKLARGLDVRGPEVIRLVDYHEIPDLEIRLTRKNLLLRDNFTCQYCNKRVSASTFTIDHVFPKSRGGDGSWENFVVSCFKCNVAKRDRTPKEAGMVLHTVPKKPKWYPLTTRFAFKTPESWVRFLPQSALDNRPASFSQGDEELSHRRKK